MTHERDKSGRCCPELDTKLWDEKIHVWKNKPFIMDTIPEFFHIPLPWMFGKAVGKMWELAQKAGAAPEIAPKCAKAYGHNYCVAFAEVA